MPDKPPKKRRLPLPEPPEYIQQWAKDLVKSVGKREARKLLTHYEGLAANHKLAKSDREVAQERVQALSKLIYRSR